MPTDTHPTENSTAYKQKPRAHAQTARLTGPNAGAKPHVGHRALRRYENEHVLGAERRHARHHLGRVGEGDLGSLAAGRRDMAKATQRE